MRCHNVFIKQQIIYTKVNTSSEMKLTTCQNYFLQVIYKIYFWQIVSIFWNVHVVEKSWCLVYILEKYMVPWSLVSEITCTKCRWDILCPILCIFFENGIHIAVYSCTNLQMEGVTHSMLVLCFHLIFFHITMAVKIGWCPWICFYRHVWIEWSVNVNKSVWNVHNWEKSHTLL